MRKVRLGPEDGVGLVDDEEGGFPGAQVEERIDVDEVAVHREDGVGDHQGAASTTPAEQCREMVEIAMSVDRHIRGARRQPSMIDAWFSSSLHTSTPGPANVVMTPRFVANPVGNSAAAGIDFHSASSRSRSAWTGRAPTMRRADPAPAPQRSSASCAAAMTAGCALSPR